MVKEKVKLVKGLWTVFQTGTGSDIYKYTFGISDDFKNGCKKPEFSLYSQAYNNCIELWNVFLELREQNVLGAKFMWD